MTTCHKRDPSENFSVNPSSQRYFIAKIHTRDMFIPTHKHNLHPQNKQHHQSRSKLSRAEGIQPLVEGDGECGVKTKVAKLSGPRASSHTAANKGGESSRAEGNQPSVEGVGERGVCKTSSNTVANKGGESIRAEGVQPIVEGDGERGVGKTSSNTAANEGGEAVGAEGGLPRISTLTPTLSLQKKFGNACTKNAKIP